MMVLFLVHEKSEKNLYPIVIIPIVQYYDLVLNREFGVWK